MTAVINNDAHDWSAGAVELVHRTAIVRLGPGGPDLYYPSNHGVLGVTSVGIDEYGYLVVNTDFDPATETCLHAAANVDLTLARKGVFTGASGGGAVTKFGIYSSRRPSSSGGVYPVLRPDDAYFNVDQDNLWLHFISAKVAAQ